MNFVKLSSNLMLDDKFQSLAPSSILTYLHIRKYSDGNYKPCFPSIETIANDSGQSIPTVKRAISELKSKQILGIANKGFNNPNHYSFKFEFDTFDESKKVKFDTYRDREYGSQPSNSIQTTSIKSEPLTRSNIYNNTIQSSYEIKVDTSENKEIKSMEKNQKSTKKKKPEGTGLIFDLPHTPEEIAKLEQETVAWFQSKGITDNSDLLLKICEDLEFALTVKAEYSFKMKEGALKKPLNWLIGAISKHPNFNKWDYSDSIEFLQNKYNRLRKAKRVNAAIEAKRQIIRDFKAQHGNQEFASLKAKIFAWLPEVERIADRNPDSTFNKELMQAIDEINKTGKTVDKYLPYENNPTFKRNLHTEYKTSMKVIDIVGQFKHRVENELNDEEIDAHFDKRDNDFCGQLDENVIPFEQKEAV